jgi:methyl-accepting chemotaxis protein
MRIQQRLLLGFTLVVLATTGLGAYAIYAIRTQDEHVGMLFDKVLMSNSFAHQAYTEFVKVDRALAEALTAGPGPARERAMSRAVVAERAFFDDLEVVNSRTPTPASMAVVAEIRKGYDAWKAGPMARLAQAGQPGSVPAGEQDAQHAIEEKLTALADSAAESGFASRLAAGELGRLSLFVAGGAMAAAILVSLVVSVVLSRGIIHPMRGLTSQLQELASGEGDLTGRIAVSGRDELSELAERFNAFVGKLHDLVARVKMSALHVAEAARQLSATTEELSTDAQEQASSLEETAASLEEITATVRQNADSAGQARQLTGGLYDTAQDGGRVVDAAVAGMRGLSTVSGRISEITAVIDEIAFQTNLLALNAAVEAARAGEHGRGFAVVAAEVRGLAQRSAGAAREVKALIQESVRKVEDGTALVNRSGERQRDVLTAARQVTDLVGDIAAASAEQAKGVELVSRAMTQMERVVQDSTARTAEVSSTAQALALEAQQLEDLVGRFRVEAPAGRPGAAVADGQRGAAVAAWAAGDARPGLETERGARRALGPGMIVPTLSGS